MKDLASLGSKVICLNFFFIRLILCRESKWRYSNMYCLRAEVSKLCVPNSISVSVSPFMKVLL